jgi:TRAP-type C4-dicarboxylate transport system permease small subunit
MRNFLRIAARISAWMDNIGGIILILMMLITVADVILREYGRPIIGTYELVAAAGAMVVAFAVPQTTRENGHISVTMLIENRSRWVKDVFFVITKLFGIALFLVLSWYLFQRGTHLLKEGDVSQTLQIPAYPGAYAMAFCFFVEAFVLLAEIPKRFYVGSDRE